MAFTEFYCNASTGSNINAGDLAASGVVTDVGGTYSQGGGAGGTDRYTVSAGTPFSGAAAGQFVSVYTAGATVATFIGRVTAVNSGGASIDISLTALSGTRPANASTKTATIGGAWLGPNGSTNFPFGFVAATMTDSGADIPRVNLKNNATYSITAAVSHTVLGPCVWQGYTSSVGDGGRAIIDGGTSGTSYILFSLSGSGVFHDFWDLIFQNNGATGSANGVSSSDPRNNFHRCVVNSVRGSGFLLGVAEECEAYSCNQSNTANNGGFSAPTSAIAGTNFNRCISHDNSGSNNCGFYDQGGSMVYRLCIADTNGLHGFFLNNVPQTSISQCDAYNNGTDGVRLALGTARVSIENCNFVKNGGYGINISVGTGFGSISNCGFGSGTQVNTSGSINSFKGTTIGTVTYASGVTPWVDPANGDFRINLAAAKGAGRGAFTQTAASYAGAVGYPDIGSTQHQDAGSVIIVEDD